MAKVKLDKYIDAEQDKVVSTGFKVKESILVDFREAMAGFKTSTKTTFKFREALEDMMVDLTKQLKEASKVEEQLPLDIDKKKGS